MGVTVSVVSRMESLNHRGRGATEGASLSGLTGFIFSVVPEPERAAEG
jgi:hypothetical protein